MKKTQKSIKVKMDKLTLLTDGSGITTACPNSSSRPMVPPVHVIMNREDLAIQDDSITIARIHGVQNCISTKKYLKNQKSRLTVG